jgi:acetylornithine deacetylase/succinyl-diaminopimelate desuccinylase-like protein
VPEPATAVGDTELQEEAIEVLQRLIRFNTVNPPGDEREAIEYLRDLLADAGFECELLAQDDARPNLVARLPGADDGPVLGYLGHVDTVLATPSEWRHEPWSGDLEDGFLWGRGAIDMKSQVAAEVVAAAALARRGWRPARGELKVMCVADEEAGGAYGAQFLTEQHPDAVRCDLLVNEGGGEVIEYRGRRLYGVCCAEKGVFRFTLTADGVAGHASIPRMGDNALLKLAPLLARLGERQPEFDVTPEPAALLRALEGDGDDPAAALERVREADPFLALLVEPMLGVTVTPTQASASTKINVIPSQATIGVDCRVPPGLGEAEARARVEELLGPDGYRLEFRETVEGNRSAMESELMDAIGDWLAENDPGAEVVPTSLPGFTDSRWFRVAFPECVAYGFFPQKHMTLHDCAPLIHGADERIDVRDVGFAARFFRDLAQRVLG